ncbi:nucleotidyltransferase domain-containing protein [Candidatus Woesearchaeota archaeon]|jgi:predicted nucleotidyltransferase|nr:nucleotidyltransferase domain-containing protein [Candidatus Woesearchaeota archaeon]MBT4114587.1 nucleotidyltransferase domain-containing protein [Candidatus Woesearchaeota archaeon]MBT4248254.1 nucleotidyltransferase domain-containing protein [Candidatus Woesearchaeota archaeon]
MTLKEFNKIARKVGKVVFDIPGVRAVAVYGSLAQGYADVHSDINLIAVCSTIPKPDRRRKIFEKAFEWIVYRNDTLPDWRTRTQDFFFVDGKHISVVYKELKVLSQFTSDIAVDTHLSREVFREAVSYVYNTKVVKDPFNIFVKLKKKIPAATPQLLRYFLPDLENISLKNGWPYSSFIQAVNRKNYIYIDSLIDHELDNFLVCLHAINYKHYVSIKWATKSIRELPIKPQGTLKRVQKISMLGNLPGDIKQKIDILQSLVADLNKLILKERVFKILD